jgi:hypothetical protein
MLFWYAIVSKDFKALLARHISKNIVMRSKSALGDIWPNWMTIGIKLIQPTLCFVLYFTVVLKASESSYTFISWSGNHCHCFGIEASGWENDKNGWTGSKVENARTQMTHSLTETLPQKASP